MVEIKMIERFTGPEGDEKLLAAMGQQQIIAGDNDLAQRLITCGELVQFDAGDDICQQGGSDDDVFFILSGSTSIAINGQQVASRSVGQAVGEMAAVNATARRSATVTATEEVAALKLTAAKFVEAGSESVAFWKQIALIAGERLRQRNRFHLPVNKEPVLFVGSSAEGLPIAREIERNLEHDSVDIRLWTTGVFGPSRVAIDDLLQQVEAADFAVFIFSPDDLVASRGESQMAPRDNVVFELGLFMGRLARDRVFIIKDRSKDLKIPSDLLGVTSIDYKTTDCGKQLPMMGPGCTTLRERVESFGPFTNRMALGQ